MHLNDRLLDNVEQPSSRLQGKAVNREKENTWSGWISSNGAIAMKSLYIAFF